jgi:hypothetical protein
LDIETIKLPPLRPPSVMVMKNKASKQKQKVKLGNGDVMRKSIDDSGMDSHRD